MRIIPAIDIIDGKCVRLSKGDYSTKKIYNEDPIQVATQFEDIGVEYLHVVDLDGAKSKHIINHDILNKICTSTSLKVDFGGGIKSEEDIRIAFECGANQITVGSVAATNQDLVASWLAQHGPAKLILGADCQNRNIAIHGWSQKIEVDVIKFIQSYEKLEIEDVICTDIHCDGMLQGPSVELYQDILAETNINLIASGGVSCVQDIYDLRKIGCAGVIIGKALYESHISMKELERLC